METNPQNFQDLIEAYVAGTASEAEVSMIEAQMAENAALQSEVAFQRQVVAGIRQYRKMQLKGQLASVNVSTGGLLAGTGAKIAAFIGSAGIIVAGWFIVSNMGNSTSSLKNEITSQINIQQTIDEQPVVVEVNPSQSVEVVEEIAPIAQPVVQTKSIRKTSQNINSENVVVQKEISDDVQVPMEKDADQFVALAPKVSIPEVNFDDEKEPATEKLANKEVGFDFGSSTGRVISSEKFEIFPSGSLMYRYYDNKLSLYGDFGADNYEILEINNNQGKKLVLHYKKLFYELIPTADPKKLEHVKDPVVIAQYQILKDKK